MTERFSQATQMLLNTQLNYDKTINRHKIGLMAGFEQMQFENNYFTAARTDYPSTALPQLFAGSSDKQKQSNNGSAGKTSRMNYFGRATYDYAEKYLVQLLFRYDGSPNFPENKRWGFFPGISLGWRISEESFMSDFSFLDNLKIRASYGEMGNDRVSAFQYLTSYQYGSNYVIGNVDVIGLVQSGVPNPNITWEISKSTNIGMESTMWNGLLGIELDLFKSKRSNILTKRTVIIPDYTGLTLPDENIGIVENKGIELQLSHRKTVNRITYSVKGNFSFARNKVIFADEAPAAEEYQKATGLPIGSALYYEAIGIFKSIEEIASYPHLPGTRPGDIKYKNNNSDDVLNDRDRIRIDKTATPEIIYGINANIKYTSFDLTVLLQGQENASVFLGGYFPMMSYSLGNFVKWRAEDRWSLTNIDATQPRGSVETSNNNTLASTHWLMDAGFLRLKNVELGYNLPESIRQKTGIKDLRVYVSAHNLLILYDHMKALGFDPETSDYWYYPQQRTFNIGINLTF
ncbi:MAG: SusC/RagA family TonB-linked outer membrane protein [Bacteroidales bacterium]|nr:SusC/RagA family TonB-linked outer membrane protein [Bacteroidales bacterium]